MKKGKRILLVLSFVFVVNIFFIYNNIIFSKEINHVVISEIQIEGETVNDEFIKIYNSTNSEINLNGWDLKRKTKSGSENNILNNIEGIISAHGYFFISPRANCGENNKNKCYKGTIFANDEYTTNSFLANNNTVLLYDRDGKLIDKVGWGHAVDFEGKAISINLGDEKVLKRKMVNNVIQDTDNNQNDFVLELYSQQQNVDVKDSKPLNGSELSDNNQNNFKQTSSIQNDKKTDNNSNQDKFSDIIITEFLSNPEGSDKDDEFIEIYNNGDKNISLQDWSLEDKAGKITIFLISKRESIESGEYKVFYRDETKITLNNSGDGVILKNDKGNIIDETPISGSVKEEQSYALDEDKNWVLTLRPTAGRENIIKKEIIIKNENVGENSESLNNLKSRNQNNNINDKQDNSIQENDSYDYSDEVIISEVYPNPFGRDNREGNYEWIELYNNSDENVNLRGWQIDDILNKGSKAYIVEEDKIIEARNFVVFKNIQTKIILNNFGDEINLIWPDEQIVDSVKYEKAIEGFSYNLSPEGLWKWSSETTLGKSNKIKTAIIKSDIGNDLENGLVKSVEHFNSENDPNIIEDVENNYIEAETKELKYFIKHTKVKISGTVSTPPGIFADNIFYLTRNGIQVYSYQVKIPKIELGDFIEIVGRLSEIGGENRILLDNTEDIKIISRNNLVEPKLISTGDVGENVIGSLVVIEGKILEAKGYVFYVDDGSGRVKIYIKPQTSILKPEIKKDDWVVVTGQVSRTSLGYRILPRFQNDIKIARTTGTSVINTVSKNKKLQIKSENNQTIKRNFSWKVIFFMLTSLIVFDWGRMRIKNKTK